jgi:hypothetical protein
MLQHDFASKRELDRQPEPTSHTPIVHGLKSKDLARALQHPAAAPGVKPRTVAKLPASGKTKCPQRIEPCYGKRETVPYIRVSLTVNEADSISDQGLERLDGQPLSGCQFVIDGETLSGMTERSHLQWSAEHLPGRRGRT